MRKQTILQLCYSDKKWVLKCSHPSPAFRLARGHIARHWRSLKGIWVMPLSPCEKILMVLTFQNILSWQFHCILWKLLNLRTSFGNILQNRLILPFVLCLSDDSKELHLQRTFEIYRKNFIAEVFLGKNNKWIFNSIVIY